MGLPWQDWQFWAVTLAAGWGLWSVLRPFLPRRGEKADPCPGCAVGTAACARPQPRERARAEPSGLRVLREPRPR